MFFPINGAYSSIESCNSMQKDCPLYYIVLDQLDQKQLCQIYSQDTGTDRLFEREKEEDNSIV